MDMSVIKRNGQVEPVQFDKVLRRISKAAAGLKHVKATVIAQRVVAEIVDKIHTTKLDELTGEICAMKIPEHPDYGTLAARIAVSNLHKQTQDKFSQAVLTLSKAVDVHGKPCSVLSPEFVQVVASNADELDAMVQHDRDYLFDFFGMKTLEKGYLLRSGDVIVERPQYMWLRVAVGIHGCGYGMDLARVRESYDLLSQMYFTHATPTLFNMGTNVQQASSCFLIQMKGDSIDGIFQTLHRCAMISKLSGGIGLAASNVRAGGSHIRSTNGKSNGIVPMLKVFNDTARYVDQAGKRKGSFAIYMEPWHADIQDFLVLKKNHGAEEERARDLFLALWLPDLFMKRVEADAQWTLMCPDECPGLTDCYGDDFEELYCDYEAKGKGRRSLPARQLWFEILEAQIETGVPYLLSKDAANRRSNQKNLGVIKSSNLCAEVIEHTSAEEIAVCNLASIGLPRFVIDGKFDFAKLREVTGVITRNLNKVIDVNYYPVEEARRSNLRHRPIGIGIQGLADVFAMLKLAFDSPEAAALNRAIMEHIYYASIDMSCQLAEASGSYETFAGSPASQGQFQFDMWPGEGPRFTMDLDWSGLRARMQTHGLRNSLCIALMPTASTSQILGNNESFEPFTSNLYVRRVLAGEFIVANKHLVRDLEHEGLWDANMQSLLIKHKGRVSQIESIPEDIRQRYKTVWEIKQRVLIDQARDRAPFVCQSQSMNLFFERPSNDVLSTALFYAWRKGLVTLSYYIRTQAAKYQAFQVEEPACATCTA